MNVMNINKSHIIIALLCIFIIIAILSLYHYVRTNLIL